MDNSITVSVFMMTYNHEKFIAQALDSVLMQKVNFIYEIVLGEDCSTDTTREIVVKYAERYPDKFKLILHKTNVGATNNQNEVFANCTGKFIAMLEGDDYWTDPLKLQKQVDFLKNNEAYSAVITNRMYVNHVTGITNDTDYPETITTASIFSGEVLPTQCVLFRNNLDFGNFKKFFNHTAADRVLSYLLSLEGPIYCIKDVTAVYNYTGFGVWSKINQNKQYIVNAKSLKEFHDLVGLPQGNKYMYKVMHSVIHEMSKDRNKIDNKEILSDFGISVLQLMIIRSKIQLSTIKKRLWTKSK